MRHKLSRLPHHRKGKKEGRVISRREVLFAAGVLLLGSFATLVVGLSLAAAASRKSGGGEVGGRGRGGVESSSRDAIATMRVEGPSVWDNLHACSPRTFSTYVCREAYKGPRSEDWLRGKTTCSFPTDPLDVVFGVWHSLNTEHRLEPMLDTWGQRTNIVLLASSVGLAQTTLFGPGQRLASKFGGGDGKNGTLLLMDTGVEQDDYFSTLGKGLLGLRNMLTRFPDKKWFVVLGDDNYLVLENYLSILSAFDPEEEWTLSHTVYRNKFGCKVAGGSGIATSRAMTELLSPQLEPHFTEVLDRTGGDVRKAKEADKFHDISFQTLVEDKLGKTVVHVQEFLHLPPGAFFDPQYHADFKLPATKPAVFHYVTGSYMAYLDFATTRVCVCQGSKEGGGGGGGDSNYSPLLFGQRGIAGAGAAAGGAGEGGLAVGVYGAKGRRTDTLDLRRISNTWGKNWGKRGGVQQLVPRSSGAPGSPSRWASMLRDLRDGEATRGAAWFLLVDVSHYVVKENVLARAFDFGGGSEEDKQVLLVGPAGDRGDMLLSRALLDAMLLRSAMFGPGGLEDQAGGSAVAVGDTAAADLASQRTNTSPFEGLLKAVEAWAPSALVLSDAGLMDTILLPQGAPQEEEEEGGGGGGGGGDTICAMTFPMVPDLGDLKSEFVYTEGNGVMAVTHFLLEESTKRQCSVTRRHRT